MFRKITLFAMFLVALGSVAAAQPGEFPWQLGRGKASTQTLSTTTSTIRLAAPVGADGAVTVQLFDQQGLLRGQMPAVAHNGEVILSLPKSVASGVYLYRVVAQGNVTEGKLIVPRSA